MAKKVIFYELNEVPFRIFDYFAEMLPNSSIAKLRKNSWQVETYAEDLGHLSPWVTWPSLHRGVINTAHEISDFGQDLSKVNKDYPSMWDILVRNNVKVGVFGSLHTYPLSKNINSFDFFVPDTFAAGPECFPEKYNVFQEFNLAMAGNNASQVNSGIKWLEAAKFIARAPELGLSWNTVMKILKQLAYEQIDPNKLVRRRTSQVQISFDFYFKALVDHQPDISFFFTNHVASSMHRYWPALFPQDYKNLNYGREWISTWSEEIKYTIQEVNHQLTKLMYFAESNPGTVLCVCTSMGQEAVENNEKITSQIIIASHKKLMSSLGIPRDDWETKPAMVPQYNVQLKGQSHELFSKNLAQLKVNGKGIEATSLGHGVFRLNFSMQNEKELNVEFMGSFVDPEAFGFKKIDMQDAAGANAYHIPQGMFILFDPQKPMDGFAERSKISTLEIAPSILQNFGINKPSYMEKGFTI